MNSIYCLLGGHMAEKLYIGNNSVTTGCSSDLQRATDLAYMAVRMFGMDENYGVISAPKDKLSDYENGRIDETVHNLIKKASEHVKNILLDHEFELKNIVKNLCKYKTLTGEEVKAIVEKGVGDVKE